MRYEGRTPAEAAIRACDALGLTRSELKYEIVTDVGEKLDRKVVIEVADAPERKAAAKAEPRAESRGEGRSESRGEPRGEGRSESRGEGRSESRGEGRSEPRFDSRNEHRPAKRSLSPLGIDRSPVDRHARVADGPVSIIGEDMGALHSFRERDYGNDRSERSERPERGPRQERGRRERTPRQPESRAAAPADDSSNEARSSRGSRGGRRGGGRGERGEGREGRGESRHEGRAEARSTAPQGDVAAPRSRRSQGQQGGIDALLKMREAPGDVPALPSIEGTSKRSHRALEVVQKLTTLMGLDLKAALVLENEAEVHVHLTGAEEKRAIGQRGEVLLALQFITNRIISRFEDEGEQVLVLDAGGHRQRRQVAIEALARTLAERSLLERKAVRLSPMSAHDRRIFHMALKDMTDIATRSEGDGVLRNLLILPAEFVS